ncbi:hypothetical protein PSACC_03612 [Paramicrosporidium saccamoebae]|uniref:GDP/GTP exchange factor Sec2 N-terminal domain-containing protein n=1 Tax=Paramicrosporidium saccamoebae TaxID=1246581 RepID=A0A2H9TFK3_9FUNG|nr:hypothetical protein PSACC_03612 [Paramicrosporidium saccamoebae]
MATSEASSVEGKPPCPHYHDGTQDSIINTVPAAEELFARQDHAQEEVKALKEKIEELQQKLWEQSEVNAELKRTRQELSEEIMDLTKALFEEANGMVAAEAKARAHLEIARRKLEGELEVTKEQLRLEKQQLYELRGRFANDHSCERQDTPLGSICEVKFDKRHLSTVLDNNYFGCLLPKHRFDSRSKCDGPAGDIWDIISQKIASEDLPEFSKFVEKCVILDAEGMLSHPYLKKICETDVAPCLNFEFKPKPFVKRIAIAMLRNTCYVEQIPTSRTAHEGHLRVASQGSSESAEVQMVALKSPNPVDEDAKSTTSPTEQRLRGFVNHFTTSVSSLPEALLANMSTSSGIGHNTGSGTGESHKFCALCGRATMEKPFPLQYRVRLNDLEPWIYIDDGCRERLVAAGHFFTFLRHLGGGLYGHRPLLELYYDMLHFRRFMFYARVATGASSFFLQSDYEAYLDFVDSKLGGDAIVSKSPVFTAEAVTNATLAGIREIAVSEPIEELTNETSQVSVLGTVEMPLAHVSEPVDVDTEQSGTPKKGRVKKKGKSKHS